MKKGDTVKIVDDFHEYSSKGKWGISWKAGAVGKYQGEEDIRGTMKGVMLCGSEAAGYFRFKVLPQYLELVKQNLIPNPNPNS